MSHNKPPLPPHLEATVHNSTVSCQCNNDDWLGPCPRHAPPRAGSFIVTIREQRTKSVCPPFVDGTCSKCGRSAHACACAAVTPKKRWEVAHRFECPTSREALEKAMAWLDDGFKHEFAVSIMRKR